MWLINSLRRGCTEQRNLRWGDVVLETDSQGKDINFHSERQTKSRQGDNSRNIRPVKPRMYENKSQCEIFPFVLLNLWTSYENRDTVEFVGRSKYCLEISKTWERLACSSLLRSSSAAMKIEMAGIYWPQANVGNSSWYWGEVKLLTFLRGSLWRLSFGHETLNGCFALQG